MKNIHLLTLNVGVFVAIIVALTVGGFIPDITGITITIYGTALLIGLGIASIVTSPDKEIDKIEIKKEELIPENNNNWIRLSDKAPTHNKIVLVCIDSYDCGWVFEKAWWDPEENYWITGFDDEGKKEFAHIEYTHWKYMEDLRDFPLECNFYLPNGFKYKEG